jgi:glycosyltransferase involved in cell wall biosynthesis
VNIFHINGDEVSQVMRQLSSINFSSAYNVVYPAWELEGYPGPWAGSLDTFDEIWAPTRFIESALTSVVHKPVRRVPLASEVILEEMLSRRYFGIPESAFAFLFSFDFRSYVTRKHPEAVIASFEQFLRLSQNADAVLVVKMHGPEQASAASRMLLERLEGLGARVIVINRTMSDSEMRNLIRICDCYISLHRSEGFGRGLAEAMFLGRPVIATGYSGNLDFMSPDDSVLIDFQLIDLQPGDYPFWEGQHWADPDVDQAAEAMHRMVQNPQWARELGRKAAIAIRKRVGFRVSGLRYWESIQEILARY